MTDCKESQMPVDSEDPRREETPQSESFGFRRAAAKVREFPTTPGVYLMKDSAERVIYVGKAVNLRSRASSYFLKAAAADRRTADLVGKSATSITSKPIAKSTLC